MHVWISGSVLVTHISPRFRKNRTPDIDLRRIALAPRRNHQHGPDMPGRSSHESVEYKGGPVLGRAPRGRRPVLHLPEPVDRKAILHGARYLGQRVIARGIRGLTCDFKELRNRSHARKGFHDGRRNSTSSDTTPRPVASTPRSNGARPRRLSRVVPTRPVWRRGQDEKVRATRYRCGFLNARVVGRKYRRGWPQSRSPP